MTDEFWLNVKILITELLNAAAPKLDLETINGVKHYLDHDEYEMAFEGLFIDLIELSIVPDVDLTIYLELGKKLKLNEEAIFDANFWGKFQEYILTNTRAN